LTDFKLDNLKSVFKEKKRVSINFKLAVAIILSGVIALGAFFLFGLIEKGIIQNIGKSDKIKNEAVNAAFQSFEAFIKTSNLTGDDSEAMQTWVTGRQYTELIVSDENGDKFASGSKVDASTDADKLKKNLARDTQDLYNRELKFLDKNYYVYINVYNEYRWKAWLDNIKLILAALLFLVLVLVYNRHTLKRIIRLSDEVNLISEGELDREIITGDDDEIGTLANDVDAMRNSILEKMNNEKAAWDANAQLITSMSHDIRTPLTSLIGYLDIIAGHKYNSEEELQKYINSCSDKAVQLKGLSDKLFQYFLVYNNKVQERELETLDAGILFQQFMLEHISELTQYDYSVDLDSNIPEGVMIDTDPSAMQRLFDNLFSNIMKYADENHPIEIRAGLDGQQIFIVIKNHIAEAAKKVESTKIGVKTCKKIVEDLSGKFHALEEDNIYTSEIYYPVKEIRDPEQEESGAAQEDGGAENPGEETPAGETEPSAGTAPAAAAAAEPAQEAPATLKEKEEIASAAVEEEEVVGEEIEQEQEAEKEFENYLPEGSENAPGETDPMEDTKEIS